MQELVIWIPFAVVLNKCIHCNCRVLWLVMLATTHWLINWVVNFRHTPVPELPDDDDSVTAA
mgnify:CR=1 FL=1